MSQHEAAVPVKGIRERFVVVDAPGGGLAHYQRPVEQLLLHIVENSPDPVGKPLLRNDFFPGLVAARHFHVVVPDIAGADGESDRHPLHFVFVEFPAGTVRFASIHPDADARGAQHCFDALGSLEHNRPLFIFPENGYDHDLYGSETRRQDQSPVIRMRHDERPDQPGRDPPGSSPHIFEPVFAVLELAVERFGEILAEEMTGAGLQRLAILHHGFDTVRVHRTRKTFACRFHAPDNRHGHPFLGKSGVYFQHAQRFLDGFLLRFVGSVPFLPEKFHRAQKQPRTHFPAHYVCPLIDENRQVAPGLNPVPVGVPDDRFACGPDDKILLQLRSGIG